MVMKTHNSNDKLEARFIWLVGLCSSVFLFLFNDLGLDFSDTQLIWTKVHLQHYLEYPYFTPALCGGFLLGADPNSTIFTFVQLMFVFVADPLVAWRLALFLASVFFAIGGARLFRIIGVRGESAQAIGGWILPLSGYWLGHRMHIAILGISFLPWLMVEAISQSIAAGSDNRPLSPTWWRRVVTSAAMIFLLINSGHFWPLPGLFLLGPVLVASGWNVFWKNGSRGFMVALSSFFLGAVLALAMSSLRFAAIFTFAVQAFPREVGIFGVIGDTKYLVITLLRSFFDFTVITGHEPSGMLGGFHEWTAYMGLLSLPLILIGIVCAKPKEKWFYGLLVSSILQLILTRTSHFGELFRTFVPALKEISWYYRGIIVHVFTASFFVALGVQRLTRMTRWPIASIIFILLILDFSVVYIISGTWSPVTEPVVQLTKMESAYAYDDPNPAFFDDRRVACYNPILGYTAGSFHSQVGNGSILNENILGFYNINDVRALFSPQGRSGIYRTEPWPLWLVADRIVLDEFLMFKQVNELPPMFFWIRIVCITGWIGFVLAIVAAGRAYLFERGVAAVTRLK